MTDNGRNAECNRSRNCVLLEDISPKFVDAFVAGVKSEMKKVEEEEFASEVGA